MFLGLSWSAHGVALLAAQMGPSALQQGADAFLKIVGRPTPIVYSVIQFLLAVYFFVANKNARALENANELSLGPELGDEELNSATDDESEDLDAAPKGRRVMSIWSFTPASMLWWHFVPIFGFFSALSSNASGLGCKRPNPKRRAR